MGNGTNQTHATSLVGGQEAGREGTPSQGMRRLLEAQRLPRRRAFMELFQTLNPPEAPNTFLVSHSANNQTDPGRTVSGRGAKVPSLFGSDTPIATTTDDTIPAAESTEWLSVFLPQADHPEN